MVEWIFTTKKKKIKIQSIYAPMSIFENGYGMVQEKEAFSLLIQLRYVVIYIYIYIYSFIIWIMEYMVWLTSIEVKLRAASLAKALVNLRICYDFIIVHATNWIMLLILGVRTLAERGRERKPDKL
ncbi:hypothetical protein ACOSQ3_024586 [Xanthoceras sorbifolium]